MTIAGILVGGALGALCRYWLTLVLQASLASTAYATFPLGTLLVNVAGSFLLSFLTSLGLAGLVPPAVRIAIGSGFLGALTTFSTLELETDELVRSGEAARAILFVSANLVLGYAAILAGRYLATPLGAE